MCFDNRASAIISSKLGRLLDDVGKLAAAVRDKGFTHGVKFAWAAILSRLHLRVDARFDAKYGVDTFGAIPLDNLSVASQNKRFAESYSPSHTLAIKRVLARLPIDHRDFDFVDFGSGKGKVVLMAAMYPYRRVVGVEFALELHDTACENIEAFPAKERKAKEVQSIIMDAATFAIPPDNCVFYFYDPFGTAVLSKIVDKMAASHEKHRQKIYVIYYEPDYKPERVALLDNADFLRRWRPPRRLAPAMLPAVQNTVFFESIS